MAFNCAVQLRKSPIQHKKLVRIGCGAGFAGDRPAAALKLLSQVQEMDYLILECLAERTLAIRHEAMMSGGKGYDPRISDWMQLLLPEAVKNDVCIITNMGATDALSAQAEVLKVAKQSGLCITVGVAWEVFPDEQGSKQGSSTYLGAAPVVNLLETSKPDVIITTRLADAALFLGPMVYELGWNWNDFHKLAQGTLAGHLLECGCQVTGGYFMHPADEFQDMSAEQLLKVSLPYAEICHTGEVILAKPKGSGGELSVATCAQQLLYEVGDPSAYITPDVVVDFTQVTFQPLTADIVSAKGAIPGFCLRPEKLLRLVPRECGWKAWGEISYGGSGCIQRAKAAEYLVRSWMEGYCSGISRKIISYLIGLDSLHGCAGTQDACNLREVLEIRLRLDGLFSFEEQAVRFTREFEALYTNGPAGGGGIRIGCHKEIYLEKVQVLREESFWKMCTQVVECASSEVFAKGPREKSPNKTLMDALYGPNSSSNILEKKKFPSNNEATLTSKAALPAPVGVKVPLYKIAHCRAGDKGNDVNFSLIPHCLEDLSRLKSIVTSEWVKTIMRKLVIYFREHSNMSARSLDHIGEVDLMKDDGYEDDIHVEIYEVLGIQALNIVVRNALDGGVNCSR